MAGPFTAAVACVAGFALPMAMPVAARAQSTTALPDTTPLPILGDSAPPYLSKFGRLDNAVHLADPSYHIVVAASPTAAQLDADRRRGAPLNPCPPVRAAVAMPGDSDQLVSRHAADLLVVVATAVRSGSRPCETGWNATTASVWRAAFYADSNRRSTSMPLVLALEADGKPVAPVASVSRPAYEWRDGTWVQAGSQLRYYFDIRLLGSRPDGGVPSLTLRVWGNSASPSSFTLSEDRLARLEDEYEVWRFASRQEAPGLRVALQPRRKVTGVLASALAEAREGRVVQGALAASTYLAMARADSVYEQGVARALVADVEYRLGDSARARSLVTGLHRDAACLRLPSGAAHALQTFADSLANGRCEMLPLRHVALAGLAVPGGGRYAAGSPLAGTIVTGIVGSLFVGALLKERTARAHYAQYETATMASEAISAYRMATDARAQARTMALSAVVAWVLDDLLALANADYRNRRIVRDRL